MTVFKGYMKILKKNLGLVSIYLVIFFSVAMALQAAARKDRLEDFQKTSVNVAVADQDDSILSHALTDYLGTIHNVSEISSDPAVMQEELYYRNTEYIVQIPKNFYETCIVQGTPISVTKVPGSYTSFYVDQQINAWLNNIRTYISAGFSQEEASKAALVQPTAEVSMYQDATTITETPGYTYYFRYVPYLFLAVLCYSMGYLLLAFQKEDIQKRMQASAISIRRQNLEGLLAMFTLGFGLWLIAIIGAVIMYQKDFLASRVLLYYLLNTFLMMTVALSLSYLLGLFIKNSNMLSGISNIVSLGMCFLSGVFVPMSIMDKKVLKIAQFLPVYWYESINETLSQYRTVSVDIAVDIWKSMGIEVMFTLAFLTIILAVSKYKRQR
ncbi:ABC transporter permease [Blautia sp. MSJ-19]|uniref:ABC transporter permease n=1 Tax=Blautia sp. MSJ-19 TaxID=2841517 RepID=UPI001C0EF8B9|nr:ABC transporter permease [Blautia sp. MSJ-19]MBU5482183.1 ABC transporter permease [Blautia sp. MSJ-19]